MIETLAYASHVAYLDPMTGEGLLVLPRAAHDLDPPTGNVSLHEADWDAVIKHLNSIGWEPTEDDDGGIMYVGTTADRRDAISLYGREPVTSLDIEQSAEAWRELLAESGVTPA